MKIAINGLAIWQSLFLSKLTSVRLAVDATAGNGYDTLFLAAHTQPDCRIWALDIQAQALEKTKTRLTEAHLENKVFFCRHSHAELLKVIPEPPDCIVFNLGYLPGGDHTMTTQAATTLPALGQALQLLRPGGWCSVMMYPGHEAGKIERELLLTWASSLERTTASVSHWHMVNHQEGAPELLLLEKPC